MEPREFKLMAEIMMVAGVLLALLGLGLIYGLDMRTEGAIPLIIGSALALLSLPVFMVLMILSTVYHKE